MICRQKHERGFSVCCLAWHPSGGQIAYTDTEGRLGLLDGVGASGSAGSSQVQRCTHTHTHLELQKPWRCRSSAELMFRQPAAKDASAEDYDDLFDNDDDGGGVAGEGPSDSQSPVKEAAVGDDDEDDFFLPATGRVRNRGVILDEENSLGE